MDQIDLTDPVAIDRAICQASFQDFVRHFWHVVSPDRLVWGWHLDTLCQHLQALAEGRVKNLVVNIPPRHGKSILCAVLWPAWLWCRNPSERINHLTNTQNLTLRDANESRRLVTSQQYQKLFPEVCLEKGREAVGFYETTARGHRLSTSVNSDVVGQNATVMICDDLHTYGKAESDTERQKAIRYYFEDFCSRAQIARGHVPKLVIGQRVHGQDITGVLFDTYKDSPDWTFLVLPGEYRGPLPFRNQLGFTDPRRDIGQLLFPEGAGADWYTAKKQEFRHRYQCLVNQDPTPREGNRFKAEWFRYYSVEGDFYVIDGQRYRRSDAWRFAMADVASSTQDTADYTACAVFDSIGPYLFLVYMLRERLDGNHIIPKLKGVYDQYRPTRFWVEKEFTGIMVLDQLRKAGVPVLEFQAKKYGDKEARSVAAQLKFEAKEIFFPRDLPVLADLEAELLGFPNAPHDDMHDTLSASCTVAHRYRRAIEPVRTPEEESAYREQRQKEHFNRLLNWGLDD